MTTTRHMLMHMTRGCHSNLIS